MSLVVVFRSLSIFFFFKQKTAYEMRISDWSSDVCSSDLQGEELDHVRPKAQQFGVKEIFIDDLREEFARDFVFPMFRANALYEGEYLQIGRASCRERVCQYV